MLGFRGLVQRVEQREIRRSNLGLDHILDPGSFDEEFTLTGELSSFTSYVYSGRIREHTFYFYNEADELVLSVDCDADGRCREVSHRRAEADGQWVYWTTRKIDGTVTGTSVDHYREGRLVSTWSNDGEGRTKREKHFQYAGDKRFKSVSFYYAGRQIVERWITSYDSEGRVRKTFGLTGAGLPLGDGKYILEYDEEGRKKHVWSFNDWDPSEFPNALTVYEYDCDDQGNWNEQRRFHQFRGDTSWTMTKTIRKLTYFP